MMNRRPRWRTLLSCCSVVAVSAATVTTVTRQSMDTAATAQAHGVHRTTLPPRCARRTTARGTVRFQGPSPLNTQNLNPFQGDSPPGTNESYFGFDNKLKMIPVMATEVPTLKNGGLRDGGKTIIVHLKKGLRWSNGAEITAADAKFGWRIDTDKATGPLCTDVCAEVRTVQTPSRYTVIYRLAHVTPTFLPYNIPDIVPIRWPGAWKDDPHAAAIKLVKDPTFDFKGPHYPTNGPYQVARVVEGKEVVLTPMKYWTTMACGASISTIILENSHSAASTISAAAAGRIDLWDTGTNGVLLLPEIQRHSGYTSHIDPAGQFEHLEFNVDSTYNGTANPLHDAKVRLALALALDKQQLLRTVLPLTARQARGLVAWTPWINAPTLAQQYADKTIRGQWDPIAKAYVSTTGHGRALTDARTLLASTRWKHGFTIDFQTNDFPRRRAAVPILTAAWARIGVTVNPTFHDPKSGNGIGAPWNKGGIGAHGAFQVMLSTNGARVPDDWVFSLSSQYIVRRQSDHSLPGANDSGIDNPVIDRAFRRAGRTVDNKIRARSFAAIQREVNRQAYWVPLYFVPTVWTTSGRVENVSYGAGDRLTWNMWAWTLKAHR